MEPMLRVDPIGAMAGKKVEKLTCGERLFLSDDSRSDAEPSWYMAVHCDPAGPSLPKVTDERPPDARESGRALAKLPESRRPYDREPEVEVSLPCGGRFAVSNGVGEPVVIACAAKPKSPRKGGKRYEGEGQSKRLSRAKASARARAARRAARK
jgi:hypothetical protein